MAEPKDGGKRQTSFSIDERVLQSLDNWIEYQRRVNGYEVDRSFVATTLFRKFMQQNGLSEEELSHLESLRQIELESKS